MKPYLFGELMALIAGVWLLVVVFVVYGWLLLKRQKRMVDLVLERLPAQKTEQEVPKAPSELEPLKEEPSEPVHLEISRDEPLSKYENFVPGENVDVSFVDKKE